MWSSPDSFRWSDAPLSSFAWPAGAIAVYLVVIYSIQWHVKVNRKGKPFDVQRLFAYHNLLLSAGSLAMFLGTLHAVWQRAHADSASDAASVRFMFCETDLARTAQGGAGVYYFWSYVYYLSKYYELLDTVFLALKGKLDGWGGLNVYHHTLVLVMAWLWLTYCPSLQHIGILFNTFVHVLMYYYFYLAGVGAKPRWKKLVTLVQIVQFVTSFACLVPNVYMHFASTAEGGAGCVGQTALLFNCVFNCTLLLEFVSIFSKPAAARGAARLDGATGGKSAAAKSDSKEL